MADTIIGAHDGTFKTDGSISMRETQEFLALREGLSASSFESPGLEGSISIQKLYDASNAGEIVLAGNAAYPSSNYSLGGLRGANYTNNTAPVIQLLGPNYLFGNNENNISDLPGEYVGNILSYNPDANFENFEYNDNKYWYAIYWQGFMSHPDVNTQYLADRTNTSAYAVRIINRDLGGTYQNFNAVSPQANRYTSTSGYEDVSDYVLYRFGALSYNHVVSWGTWPTSYRSTLNSTTSYESISRANFYNSLEVNAIGYRSSSGIVDRGLTPNHLSMLNKIPVTSYFEGYSAPGASIWGYNTHIYDKHYNTYQNLPLLAHAFIFPIKNN